jgi:hypothetical protein
MLTMDLAQLPKSELADAVSHYCGQYGAVKSITILKPPERPDTAYALVSMGDDDGLERVVRAFGASKVASLAVIRIEQAAPAIPASLLKSSRATSFSPALH